LQKISEVEDIYAVDINIIRYNSQTSLYGCMCDSLCMCEVMCVIL